MIKIKNNIAISDSGFVFDARTGDSFTLNTTGLEIVQLIKEGKDYQGVLQVFLDKYEVDPESFERYYLDFVATLKHMNLIEGNGED